MVCNDGNKVFVSVPVLKEKFKLIRLSLSFGKVIFVKPFKGKFQYVYNAVEVAVKSSAAYTRFFHKVAYGNVIQRLCFEKVAKALIKNLLAFKGFVVGITFVTLHVLYYSTKKTPSVTGER